MSASKVLMLCWLGLAVLTTLTVALGNAGSTSLLAGAVLAIAAVKAWLITDGFMELRHAPALWRLLLLGWPLVMACGILLAIFV